MSNKELVYTLKVNTATGKSELRDVEGKFRNLDEVLGEVDTSVNNIESSIVSMAASFFTFKGLINTFKSVVSIGSEFEAEMSGVKAVSNATQKEFNALTEDALRLGATTKYTATEISRLQIELGTLGYTSNQIIKMTGSISNLASATRESMDVVARTVGTTLNQFKLEASQADRVADVMAKSFSSSALNLHKFSESMKYAAPVAKALGLSIEETTSFLGILADAGIDGSLAGTAMKQVFSQMKDESSSLAQVLGGTAGTFEEFIDLLEDAKERGKEFADDAIVNLDERLKAAVINLADSSEEIENLSEKLEDATGSAKEMSDIQLDNLSGDVTLLNSALSGLANTIYSAVSPALREGTQLLTDSVTFLTENKTVLAALSGALTVAGGAMDLATGKALLANLAVNKLVMSVKALNLSLLSNPYTLVAAGITSLIFALVSLRDTEDELIEKEKKYNKEVKSHIAQKKKSVEVNKDIICQYITLAEKTNKSNSELTEEKKLYNLLQEIYPGQIKSLDEIKDKYKELTDAVNEYTREEKILKVDEFEKELISAQNKLKDMTDNLDMSYSLGISLENADESQFNKYLDALKNRQVEYVESIKRTDKELESMTGLEKINLMFSGQGLRPFFKSDELKAGLADIKVEYVEAAKAMQQLNDVESIKKNLSDLRKSLNGDDEEPEKQIINIQQFRSKEEYLNNLSGKVKSSAKGLKELSDTEREIFKANFERVKASVTASGDVIEAHYVRKKKTVEDFGDLEKQILLESIDNAKLRKVKELEFEKAAKIEKAKEQNASNDEILKIEELFGIKINKAQNDYLTEKAEKKKNHDDKLKAEEKKALQKKLSDESQYYESVKFEDENYSAWKSAQIEKQVSQMQIPADLKKLYIKYLKEQLKIEKKLYKANKGTAKYQKSANQQIEDSIEGHKSLKKIGSGTYNALANSTNNFFNNLRKGKGVIKSVGQLFADFGSQTLSMFSQMISKAFAYATVMSLISGSTGGFGTFFMTGLGFDSGGYTGDGDKLEPAGTVHKGEFVMTKEATNGNISELYGLMGMLRTGIKLKDIITPKINLPRVMVAPAQTTSYSNGGHVSQSVSDNSAMLKKLDSLINRVEELNKSNQAGVKKSIKENKKIDRAVTIGDNEIERANFRAKKKKRNMRL